MDCNAKSPRRQFLADVGMGVTGLALSAMLARDGIGQELPAESWRPPDGQPHFVPRAKSVIWLSMIGGASHVESFDPKPALNDLAGKTIAETPYKDVLQSPFLANERVVAFDPNNGFIRTEVLPLQVSFRKRGESGIEISDWWPHVGDCSDDLAIVRSMWTEDSNHGAQLQFHTGRHRVDGYFPTIGSWVHYGLGSLNDNLPQFVVLGTPLADCCGGMEGHRANYLGPQHDGVPLSLDPNNPLPYAQPEASVFREEQQAEFELLSQLNGLSAIEYPHDEVMRARIKSYELAFRMQRALPEAVRFDDESKETLALYGIDQDKAFGRDCLAARRLVERGVRFVQIYHGSNGGAGRGDASGRAQDKTTTNQ